MSPSLFVLSITLYLVSMVTSLIASFFVKYVSPRFINTLIIFHFLVLIFWMLLKNDHDTISSPGNSNYLFLAFFCSGILSAGMLIRMQYPVVIKVYFALYLLSIVVFLISPSRVLGFIVSGNIYSVSPARYHISENYYFIEQQSARLPDENKLYKIVREMGMFHKTMARDIRLPLQTDSVRLINNEVDESFHVRVFFKEINRVDSLDMKIATGKHRDTSRDIEQRRE